MYHAAADYILGMQITSKLYHGDCLKIMPTLPAGSVDMILADCPYAQLNRSNPNAAWDVELPLDKLWEQWLRICKENAAIVLFGQGMFTAKLMMSQPKLWRYNLIWDKVLKSGFLNANRMPLRRHEDICVFYKKMAVYHPQMERCEPHKRNHSKGNMKTPSQNRCYGKFVETPTIISDEKYPSSIISIPKQHINGRSYHPTQKPVELLRWLIRTYSDVGGGVVCDCTMGSGSTCVAAVLEKRRYVGIEKEQKYFDIAVKRVHEAEANPTLF